MSDERQPIHDIEAPVREVTLQEDRARVVRTGQAELPAGVVRVRVQGVAPVLSDKTLTGAVAEDGARVADARVVRELLVGYDESRDEREARAAALQAELQALDERLDVLEDERVIVERHASGLDKLAALTLAELSEDVSYGKAIDDSWAERLEELRQAERERRGRLVAIAGEIEDLRRERQRLDERIVRTQQPFEREWACIEADVAVAQAGSYTLRFEYTVPNACWRPYHTARLLDQAGDQAEAAGARVAFSTDACVWQNTGEDWRDAQLILSTERASLGTEPPTLESDILRVRRKSEAVVVETREQEVQTLLPDADDTTVVSPEVPGIDDGGEALHLRAQKLSTVPSDGRPYRVRLGSFTSDATVELIATPELMAGVLTKSTQENLGSGPILAGPVDLIRQSGLIGRTSVLFVAAGARFELGWGPEPDLRVKRETDVTEDKSRLLSSWVERVHEIEIRLSNLGGRERTVRVTERVPVSEIDKVKITVDPAGTTGGKRPDKNGFVEWQVTVAAGEHERVQLSYKLERHEDVYGL